ncbi:hypothetical protein OAO24_03945 [Methylophilaceae bacterium]|nr:hypothetical protein [Methylophilaceae bacterium]
MKKLLLLLLLIPNLVMGIEKFDYQPNKPQVNPEKASWPEFEPEINRIFQQQPEYGKYCKSPTGKGVGVLTKSEEWLATNLSRPLLVKDGDTEIQLIDFFVKNNELEFKVRFFNSYKQFIAPLQAKKILNHYEGMNAVAGLLTNVITLGLVYATDERYRQEVHGCTNMVSIGFHYDTNNMRFDKIIEEVDLYSSANVNISVENKDFKLQVSNDGYISFINADEEVFKNLMKNTPDSKIINIEAICDNCTKGNKITKISNKKDLSVSRNSTLSTTQKIPAPAPKVSIDDAKLQCSDIGFKTGTERFGECVLQLMQ